MSKLGLGVMINMLCGNEESVEDLNKCLNRKITSIKIENEVLLIGFDKDILSVWDNGQSCCEHRYMVCDDKLDEFIGANLIGMEIKDAPSIEDSESHDVQFLDVNTDRGTFQLASHNEHNGYYGGFSISCKLN